MYNATVYRHTGDGYGVFVAEAEEIDGRLVMLRSNAITSSGLEGSPAYDRYIRAVYPDSEFEIVLDDCDGFRDRLCRIGLSPAYTGVDL